MATPATVLADVATKFEGVTGAARLPNDYTDEFQDVGRGNTVYQLQGFPNGRAGIDANQPITLMSITIALTHMLPEGGAERAFTEGTLQTWLATVADRRWWSDMDSITALASDPDDFQVAIEREGDAIRVTITAQVAVKPN